MCHQEDTPVAASVGSLGATPQSATRSVEGNDAVCFTAGATGAAFGAGTIHAYLAADRKAPAVVAGISMGALNAAAMQRAFCELEQGKKQELSAEEQEAIRWRWFRRYVDALSDNPLDVFWDAIPDQSDFFADMVPIRDTSTPRSLQAAETEARRRRYLLVRLGQWLARLPVTVRRLATLLVNYVRAREKYPPLQKVKSWISVLLSGIVLITQVILHAFASARFFPEPHFAQDLGQARTHSKGWGIPFPRRGLPFLGWLNRFNFSLVLFTSVVVYGVLLGFSLPTRVENAIPLVVVSVAGSLTGLWLLARAVRWLRRQIVRWEFAKRAARFRWWLRLRIWQRSLARRILLPIAGWGIYLISWFNVVSLSVLVFVGGGMFLRAIQERPMPEYWPLALIAAVLMILPYPFLLPLYLIPRTRRWLQKIGLLRQWRRPLFGWKTYSFLLMHVASLALYLLFGSRLSYGAGAARPDWLPVLFVEARAVSRLLLMPLVAVAVVFVVFLLRKWLLRKEYLRSWPNPALGWSIFLVLYLGLVLAGGGWFHYLLVKFKSYASPQAEFGALAWNLFFTSAYLLFATWTVIFTVVLIPEAGRPVLRQTLEQLGLRRGLIHDFYLRRKLAELFDPNWKDNTDSPNPPRILLGSDPMPALLVAAPLPTLREGAKTASAKQLWANQGTPLIDALRTALAVPPIFEPTHLKKKQRVLLESWLKPEVRDDWLRSPASEHGLDLVDGSVIRQNPIPALFSYLREHPALARRLAQNNDENQPAIHVVYRVPIEGRPESRGTAATGCPTIVDVTRLSLRLSARRDTQLEVAQTNFVSRLETCVRAVEREAPDDAPYPIFADEIAPEEDVAFRNALNPTRKEVLTAVAAGCRRSLETLYRRELGSGKWTGAEVHCDALLVTIAPQSRAPLFGTEPGLHEVCQQCTRMLKRPPAPQPSQPSTVHVAAGLGSPAKLLHELPGLSGQKPRIVFVASGGVFRGAFHIGMLAALQNCKVRPDLIVGASVGTLMGGALGAMFTSGQDILGELVETFLHVDDLVALSTPLKSATREMGLRGRAIRLSPRAVRRMVLRGSRSDPGFAVAGAPAALIDALADLFMIPHRQTARIAAAFVAGHVTRATDLFLQQINQQTLRRLGIEHAVIGTSLLEHVARGLMGARNANVGMRQPFGKDIAFFGTTTNLMTQLPLLLGGYELYPGAPYDYVEAALASSAFPAVFAPREESRVFPGTGRADVFFSDGGMFDNLPFLPAVEILSRGQRGYREGSGQSTTALNFLRQRYQAPDLMVAGALNALPEEADDAAGPYETLLAIQRRASSLQDNVKIRSFEYAAQMIDKQVKRFLDAAPESARTTALHMVDGVVDAALLPVFPSSARHLNGTFAFCASTGLQRQRVQKSIADGCYQTLRALTSAQSATEDGLTARAVGTLTADQRIPKIVRRGKDDDKLFGECPFFKLADLDGKNVRRLPCPFVNTGSQRRKEIQKIYSICRSDAAHNASK